MINDLSRCLTTLVMFLVYVRLGCGLPADEVVRSETLKDMRKYMNESVEPCDNFYEFACGNWPKYHPSTNETKGTNLYEVMSEEFNQKVIKLMKIDDSTDTELEHKVKSFYRSCEKLHHKWDVYMDDLKKLANDIGQMPAMVGDSWAEDKFDWQKTVAVIQYKYYIGTIVNAVLTTDLFNTSTNAIYIVRGSNSFKAKSLYLDDEHERTRVKHKEKMTKDMIDYLGISKDVATQTATDILQFEVSLAHGDHDKNQGLQPEEMYFPTSIDKLQNTYLPVLDMAQFISTAFGSIPSNTFYENRQFLENLVKVIQTTPKKTVANFIYYTLFKQFVYKNTKDTKEQENECILKAKEYFSNVLENMIYHKYYTHQKQEDLAVMWNNLKLAFVDVLKSSKLNWIHADVKNYAIEKLNTMKLEVPSARINEEVAHIVELCTMDEEDFLNNMKTLHSMGATNERAKLYKPPKNSAEKLAQLSFTPAYLHRSNKITVPVAVLQPNYIFSTSVPSAFNFGRLGAVIGHELLHGFDDMGRKYDKVGNNADWWDSESANAFRDRVKCFIDQYSQYEFGGQQMPKRMRQGENIADNGGLRLAYNAYLKWNEDSARTGQERKQETFPGFPYNNKQLFFISYTQEGCADTYPEYKRLIVATDSHTPLELRAVAALSNLKEFSEVFNCPVGSAMNPIVKCEMY